ncbi:unnamed protein product [Closterium sp. Naga37s-1]|nr:unnamed protein product [Closterium sp. Naga37s-1]
MAIGQVVYLSPAVSAVKARLKSGTVIKVLAVKSKEGNREGSGNSSGSGCASNAAVEEKARADGDEESPEVSDSTHLPLAAAQGNTTTTPSGSSHAGNSSPQGADSDSARVSAALHAPLSRAHMVHYVDVHLPWSHSLCACCLPRMLRPSPLVAFHVSSLASLRNHLSKPLPPPFPPFRFGHKPPRFITAYSATVPLCAPPLRPPGGATAGAGASAAAAAASAAAEERAAAPSVKQQYRWKVDSAPVVAAEGMMLEWLAEPRVGLLLDLQATRRQLAKRLGMDELASARATAARAGRAGRRATAGREALWWCCWQCSSCFASYRHAVSVAAFLVLVAKFPRFVTLWRANVRSPNSTLVSLAFQFGAGRQAGGDCLASLLVQVLGVKGKQQLETGFAAHLLPLLPGGRDAHGVTGEEGGSPGREVGEGKEWREGLGGVEWEEYLQRVGEIAAQGGLAGEQYRCCCSQCGEGGGAIAKDSRGKKKKGCRNSNSSSSSSSDTGSVAGSGSGSGMVISGVDPTEFAVKCAFNFAEPWFASCGASMFNESANNRYKERVEDAAVEEAWSRLAVGVVNEERSGVIRGEGSGRKGAARGGGSGKENLEQKQGKGAGKEAKDEGKAVGEKAAATAAAAAAAAAAAGSSARLVPVNSNAVVGVFTYRVTSLLRWVRLYGPRVNPPKYCGCFTPKRPNTALPHPVHDLPNLLLRFGAVPKPVTGPGSEGEAASGWEEFPEGDREELEAYEEDPWGDMGLNTFNTGDFRDGTPEVEEHTKEANERYIMMPPPDVTPLWKSPSPPYYETLAARVEKFLRRFAPRRLAVEGSNGRLASAIATWVGRLGLGKRSWAALALGPLSDAKLQMLLRSQQEMDEFLEMLAGDLTPVPACTRCMCCAALYYEFVIMVSLAATFALRPSVMLLRCILSLFPPSSPQLKALLAAVGVAPIPAAVPDSLVAPLLEGVMEEKRVRFLFHAIKLLYQNQSYAKLLEPIEEGSGVNIYEPRGRQGKQREGEEEWCIWEEVDSWRIAAERAWPVLELRSVAVLELDTGGAAERQVKVCERMRRVMAEEEVKKRKQAQAGGAAGEGASGSSSTGSCKGMGKGKSVGGMEGKSGSGEGHGGRAGASYLEPWPGGVNPLACLREMLLGETSHCPQAHVDALSAADTAAAPHAAATGEGNRVGSKAGPRGCASPRCGKVEGAGVQLKLCSRCGKVAYCNRECQKAHWSSHKLTCQPKAKGGGEA